MEREVGPTSSQICVGSELLIYQLVTWAMTSQNRLGHDLAFGETVVRGLD